MTRKRILAGLLLAVLCAAPALGALGSGPVGMISDLVGNVQVAREASGWAPAALFAVLSPSSRLRVPAGGRATVSLLRGGVRVYLAGACEATFGPDGARLVRGQPSQMRLLRSAEAGAAPLPAGVNLDQMGGKRRALLELALDPVTLSSRPELRWRSTERFDEVEVLLEEAGSARRVFKTLVPGDRDRQELPAEVSLVPGQTYLVFLTGFRPDGSRMPGEPESSTLRVLPAEEAATLEEARRRSLAAFELDPGDPAPLVELASLCASHQLYLPALEAAVRVAALRPRDPGIRALVQRLRELHPGEPGSPGN